MDKSLTWDFVSTGGGDEDGPNNPKIEMFGGNYNYFLAREVIQNSLDARDNISEPVIVNFKLEFIPRSDFPNQEQFKNILLSQLDFLKENKDALSFLRPAIDLISKDLIPFLKISDYNTTGLNGADNDKNGGWYSLVRSTGNSVKREGSGGSFGIGKGAPFAASSLRTVFYATKNQSAVSVFQGKAELVSFLHTDGDVKRGVGSFGIKQNSVRNGELMPLNFWRKITGTDITIAGYKVTENWQDDLVESILRNFWYAIDQKDLVVTVQDVRIDHNNLEKLLVDHFVHELFKDHIKPIGNPLQYYLAVKDGTELGDGSKLPILGNCKFYFRPVEKPMNYVAMLRKSHMVIYSRPFIFPTPYSGVFICDDKIGNEELRKMEPPAHDEWDPSRNPENGSKINAEIISFIRSGLDKLKENQIYEPLDIPELYKYLPYDEDIDKNPYKGNAESDIESSEESFNRIQRQETFDKNVEILPINLTVLNASNVKNTLIKRVREKNKSKKKRTKMALAKGDLVTKIFLLDQRPSQLTYKLYLKSPITAKYNIKFIAIGEDVEEAVKILEVRGDGENKILFKDNKIRLFPITAEKIKYLEVVIDSSIKLSLKLFTNVI